MTSTDIEYYFSKKTLFFSTLFIVPCIIGLGYLTLKIYPESRLFALAPALPLLLCLGVLPQQLREIYYVIINKPAVVLTKDCLIVNTNGQAYPWADIKKIMYRLNEGKVPGGHTAIFLKGEEKAIEIPHIRIKCKTTPFISKLIDYHVRYGAGNYEPDIICTEEW